MGQPEKIFEETDLLSELGIMGYRQPVRIQERRLSDMWLTKRYKREINDTVVSKAEKKVEKKDLFAHISSVIKEANKILSLEEDWDGADGKPFQRETLDRATKFVKLCAETALNKFSEVLAAPDILPSSDGSIDIHWEAPNYELLVNIPENQDEPAEFYGDDYGDAKFKGTLKTDVANLGLTFWLTDHK